MAHGDQAHRQRAGGSGRERADGRQRVDSGRTTAGKRQYASENNTGKNHN